MLPIDATEYYSFLGFSRLMLVPYLLVMKCVYSAQHFVRWIKFSGLSIQKRLGNVFQHAISFWPGAPSQNVKAWSRTLRCVGPCPRIQGHDRGPCPWIQPAGQWPDLSRTQVGGMAVVCSCWAIHFYEVERLSIKLVKHDETFFCHWQGAPTSLGLVFMRRLSCLRMVM